MAGSLSVRSVWVLSVSSSRSTSSFALCKAAAGEEKHRGYLLLWAALEGLSSMPVGDGWTSGEQERV